MVSSSQPLFIGLMSGTSMDGVDAVLARFDHGRPVQIAHAGAPYPDALRRECLALNAPGDNEIHRAALAANAVADLYAEAVHAVLAAAGVEPGAVAALGAHGQTVRHRPELGFTVQLLNGARLTERARITTICDFRSRDIAAGGQGAPLVPAFHGAVFANPARRQVILNLGGIANVTVLKPGGKAVTGFDTGPANVLLDLWYEGLTGERFDPDGAFAESGEILPDMLAAMLEEPYFSAPPPKSTGRDLFSRAWLMRFKPYVHRPQDVQATLTALTVETVARNIADHAGSIDEVLVCGGGALNGGLMRALARALAPAKVASSADYGFEPMCVEALAFAWLAWRTLRGEPGNLAEVTGAAGPRVLGAAYNVG